MGDWQVQQPRPTIIIIPPPKTHHSQQAKSSVSDLVAVAAPPLPTPEQETTGHGCFFCEKRTRQGAKAKASS
jgi:hypothetical protein